VKFGSIANLESSNNGIDMAEQQVDFDTELEKIFSRYDFPRKIGLDLLKILLTSSIVFVGFPIVYFSAINGFFGDLKFLIYISCIAVIFSIIAGYISFYLIFEGNYWLAHYWAEKGTWKLNKLIKSPNLITEKKLSENLKKQYDTSQKYLDWSLHFGRVSLILFISSMVLISFSVFVKTFLWCG